MNQSLEAQLVEKKQKMEELGEEVRLLTVDANPTKADMQALKNSVWWTIREKKGENISISYEMFFTQWAKAQNSDSISK